MEAVRLAVIGAGVIGRKHIASIAASTSCELVAIADPDPRVGAIAQAAGVPWRESSEVMLKQDRPDGVIVATPTASHHDVGLACIDAGAAMLMEKPVTATLDEARALIAAGKSAGVRIAVGHHRRFNPLVERARAIIRAGELGRLVAFHVFWALLKHREYFDVAWRIQPGGGPVLTNLIHDIDCLRHIAGEVKLVSALTSSETRGHEVEDTAAIVLRLGCGALGTVILSDATPSPWSYEMTARENADFFQVAENSFHFFGTEASLAVPEMRLWRYRDRDVAGWQFPLSSETRPVEPRDVLLAQTEYFGRVARGEEAPRTDALDGARTLAATLAVHEAARTGTQVRPEVI